MKYRLFSAVVLVAVALALTLTLGAGTVDAAQETETNRTTTPTTSTPTTTAVASTPTTADPDDDVARRVDSAVIVTDWSYRDGEFIITLEHRGHRPTSVTLTEAVQRKEGSGRGALRSVRLYPNDTETVTMPVEEVNDGAAVSITTPETVEAGYYVYLSSGKIEKNRPAMGWSVVQGLILGTAVLTGYGTFRVVRKKRDDEEMNAERVV
jgi:hypothetical protein